MAITWRGDGRFFATASLDEPGAASATLRIWERETGELHAQGAPESAAVALLPAAAWQPNGRHLYVAAAHRQLAGAAAVSVDVAAADEQREDEAEQARQAAAEGIAHVGAWKRELRRRQHARAAAAAPGGGDAGAAPESSVLLFERNGLPHGGFELPPTLLGASSIEQLAWSPDSEHLAVALAEADEDGGWLAAEWMGKGAVVGAGVGVPKGQPARPASTPPRPAVPCPVLPPGLPQQALQLWHRSNWHWYLKAERRYRCCAALHCAWDWGGAALLLHVVTAEGDYQQVGHPGRRLGCSGGMVACVPAAPADPTCRRIPSASPCSSLPCAPCSCNFRASRLSALEAQRSWWTAPAC